MEESQVSQPISTTWNIDTNLPSYRGLVLKFAKAEESRLTDPPKPDFRTPRIGKRKRSYSQDIPTTPTSDGIEFIGDPSNYTVKEPARRRLEELDEDEVLPTILMSDSRGEESGDDEQSGEFYLIHLMILLIHTDFVRQWLRDLSNM